ncbi:MAG: hypothetical protein QM765_46715 [Myxococcales bacterium]
MTRHLVLALLGLTWGSACFSPTWEARLAVDGGSTKEGDAGHSFDCDPPCAAGYFCSRDGVCEPCQPGCALRQCGDDGCGGLCGTCRPDQYCTLEGECTGCPPTRKCGAQCCASGQTCVNGVCEVCGCEGRQCGYDACGKLCGTCVAPGYCTTEGRCQVCSCQGKDCGDDGCGTSCGVCAGNENCQAGQCVCHPLCDWSQCGDDGCGGSCGQCPAGSTCQWGSCVSETCEPPCSAYQYCETNWGAPFCAEICNPPVGCQPSEICDVMTGRCQAAACDGASCQPGQGCYDPWTLGQGNVCTCLPGHDDAFGNWVEDTCAAFGQSCAYDWNAPGPAICGAPGEFEDCQVGLGCSAGLDCVDFGSGYAICLQACSLTKDCANPMTSCQTAAKKHCWYAICAQPETRPGDRQNYFRPCPSASPSDGICLPYASQDSAGNFIDIGVCVQTGSAPSLGQCSVAADRTRMSELCPQGQWCEAAAPDPSSSGGGLLGVCRSACNAAPSPIPVRACASTTEVCADMSSASQGTMNEARLGACHPSCDLLGAGACPPDALGDKAGCLPNFNLDGTGFCYPQAPGAAGKGQACTWDTTSDPRNPCGDRLYCIDPGSGGVCSGFCDTSVCTDPYQPCPECSPFSICYPLGGSVGVCY